MVKKVGGKGGRGGRDGTFIAFLAAFTLACDRSTPPPPEGAAPVVAWAPAPELALKTPGGTEVWFGDARESRDSAGATCIERTLEIRGPGGRRIVPLLYTLDTPTVLDDSTIRARLFTDCRPGPAYRVNVRTGLPVRKDP
jgi:hypothetical protein